MVGKLDNSGNKWFPLEEEETKVPGISYQILQNQVTPDRVNPKYREYIYNNLLCIVCCHISRSYDKTIKY